MKSRILLAALALAALPGHATTIVTFVDPDRYTDVSNQRWEAQATLDALEAHMKKLGDKWLGFDEESLRKMMRDAGLRDLQFEIGSSKRGDPFQVIVASGKKPK